MSRCPKNQYFTGKRKRRQWVIPMYSLGPKNNVIQALSKANHLKFDEIYIKNYQYLRYQISIIIKLITKYIFTVHVFGITNADNFPYKFDQN